MGNQWAPRGEHREAVERMGRTLARWREEAGVSQSELGRIAGISQSHLANIEVGRSYTTLRKVLQLCEIFGKNPCELFAEPESKSEAHPPGTITGLSMNGGQSVAVTVEWDPVVLHLPPEAAKRAHLGMRLAADGTLIDED